MRKVEITRGWDGYDTVASLGEHDWEGAFQAVRAWAVTHIGYHDFQDNAWRVASMPNGTIVVDFGSHEFFARLTSEAAK